MPRGHSTFGKTGTRMHESTRRLLAFIRANAGVSRKQLSAAFPDINVDAKLTTLQERNLAFGERISGVTGLRYYARIEPERVDEVKVRGPVDGPVGVRREVDIHAPWPEPYLSDVGVRSDGLQYRDCPSRRGGALVYCYRRQA